MIQVRDFTYPSSDGIHAIQARAWLPGAAPRGVVQLVHGVGEHMGRYDHTARFLAENGLLVCGEDHLGHGRTAAESDGKFGFFAPKGGWDCLVRDIRRLRELAGEGCPGVPYVLLGHSMGSFLARTYLIRYPGTLDGAVLSGTGQEKDPLVAAGRELSAALCALRGPDYVSPLVYALSMGAYGRPFRDDPVSTSWLSRDAETVRAFQNDPMCTFLPTVSMFRDMLGGVQFIGDQKNLAKMDKSTPIYFFSGDRDPVGAMGEGVKKVFSLFKEAGCRNVELTLYPGGRHEMLNEVNRQEVLEDLLDWLERTIL